MKTLYKSISLLLSVCLCGCSIPTAAYYTQLETFSKEKKKGLFGSGSNIPRKNILGNDLTAGDSETLKAKVEKYISEHTELTEPNKNNLRDLKITYGSSKEEVELLLGKPLKAVKSANKSSEVLIYKINKTNLFLLVIIPVFLIHESYYLHFENNALVKIERHYLKQIVKVVNQ